MNIKIIIFLLFLPSKFILGASDSLKLGNGFGFNATIISSMGGLHYNANFQYKLNKNYLTIGWLRLTSNKYLENLGGVFQYHRQIFIGKKIECFLSYDFMHLRLVRNGIIIPKVIPGEMGDLIIAGRTTIKINRHLFGLGIIENLTEHFFLSQQVGGGLGYHFYHYKNSIINSNDNKFLPVIFVGISFGIRI